MAQLAEVLTEQERLDAFDLGVSVASCQARAWRGVNSELRLHTEQHAQADARLLALEKVGVHHIPRLVIESATSLPPSALHYALCAPRHALRVGLPFG
jgi:hypothetical protein